MKRWLLVISLILLLAAAALTVRAWLPPLLAFVGANTDLIQGLQAAAQIVLWLGVAGVGLFSYLTGRQKPPQALPQAPKQERPSEERQTLHGTGVQAARDVKVERDLVTGDKISSQINTGGGAYVGGNIRVGGDLVGRDQILTGDGNILTGGGDFVGRDLTILVTKSVDGLLRKLEAPLPQEAAQQATEAYYGAVIDRHRYLGFRGMGVSDRIPLRLPLLDLYVPLKARVELPPGDTWRRDLSVAGRQLPAGADADLSGRLSEPVPVLDLLQKNDGLIILGDPGAGKTTFLKYLALKLALGEGGALGLGDRLPVLAPLSEYANMLGTSGPLIRLDDFITQHLHECGADGAVEQIFTAALAAGQALILLDGLDEVKDLRLRETVVKQVAAFYAFQRRKGNKFVVTSRIVGYREARLSAELTSECTLIDFDDDEIAAFVARWTAALERQAQGEGTAARTDAARERRELLDAIGRNRSVRRLAANPLLLTILAMMKRQGVTLPERRVELYDQYVTTLLSTWNRARGLGGRPASHDLDVVQTVRVLAPLALWMHEVNPGVGLVKREDLRRRLVALFTEAGEPQPDRAARQFLEDVREYAGLLLERGPEEYGFIHLTFEEYLAAVAIALDGQGDCRPIFERLAGHVGDPAWREVALLTVGYLGIRQQLPKVAGGVVEALAAEQPGAPGEAVVLAGEAVLDAQPGGVPPASKAAVIAALIPTMQAAAVPALLRRRAGLLLGRLGWLPADLDDFVAVPDGEFVYGDPGKRIKIPHRYWIAKYPVTNAQYKRFIEDKGYERREFWSADGWRWRVGSYDTTATESWAKEWLARRPPELRHQPFWWDDLEHANPIFPVVGVSWFEAEAYANWLDAQMRAHVPGTSEVPGTLQMPAGYRVRLATEEEWERAARGADGREYPWAGGFDFANANVAEETGEGIGATAVCTYPQGVSPVGAWDMSGNVWEWTHSLWSPKEARRVVRGGSWGDDLRSARCAVRLRVVPGGFNYNIGLRVVVSLSF